MARAPDDRRIALAAVAGAHGIKGELRLKLFTENADALSRHSHVLVGGERRSIQNVRDGGKTAIARIGGVVSREDADALRGALIEVDRSDLPPLSEGEYYHVDLIGLPCVDMAGSPVGSVSSIENFGAGDLLEIACEGGRKSLIPFQPGVADLADGKVTIDSDFLA